MPISANDLVVELRRRIRDTSTSNPVYSRAEIYDALRSAQRQVRGAWWLEGVYSSLSGGTDGVYPMPIYVNRINRIERSLFTSSNIAPGYGGSGDDTGWQELHDWDYETGETTNILRLGKSYWYHNIRVHYERDIPQIPIEDTLTTSILAAPTIIPLTNSASPFYQWPRPGFFQIGAEIMGYSGMNATSFLGVSRGQFGTLALRQDSQTLISPVIPELNPDHPAAEFLVMEGIHQLMLLRLQDGDTEGNRNIGAMAAEYGRMSADWRRKAAMRHQDRVATFRRTRR